MQQGSEDLAALLAVDLDQHFKQLVATYQHRLYAFVLPLRQKHLLLMQ
jgi:hypothetical protein